MRPTFQLILTASIALITAGAAQAETPEASPELDARVIAALADFQFEVPFEQAMAHASGRGIRSFSGRATTMRCEYSASTEDAETCVVTADSRTTSTPASLAHR